MIWRRRRVGEKMAYWGYTEEVKGEIRIRKEEKRYRIKTEQGDFLVSQVGGNWIVKKEGEETPLAFLSSLGSAVEYILRKVGV
jgi:hypothetical protein